MIVAAAGAASSSTPVAIPDVVVFAICAVVVLAGALGVITSRNAVHAALSLVLTLFGVAVLFIEQDAQFLAAVQVIVYAGAIVVLFLFVIMFLGVDRREDVEIEPLKGQRVVTFVLLPLALAGLIALAISAHWVTGVQHVAGSTTAGGHTNTFLLGKSIFTTYLWAFEITAALLVIAVIGAVVLARRPSGVHDEHPEPVQPASAPADELGFGPDSGQGPDVIEIDMVTAESEGEGRVTINPEWYLSLAAVLFTMGAVGVLVRRNVLVMIMCIGFMLNAANLTFVTFSRALGDIGGQSVVFFVLVVAAAEVVVGLGIVVAIFRRRANTTADDLHVLKG